MNSKASKEVQDQAMKIAKGTQKKNQTKEQTKLIAQGIEKGVAEYKKQQNKKSRERDKQRKQQLKDKQRQTDKVNEDSAITTTPNNLPWILLIASWLFFVAYVALF